MKNSQTLLASFISLTFLAINLKDLKAESVTYKLLNGDSISGELLSEQSNDQLIVIQHPYLGLVKLESSYILPDRRIKKWTNDLEAGISGKETGSSNVSAYALGTKTKYRDRVKEFEFNNSYNFEKTTKDGGEELTGVNKAFTRVRFDRLLGSSWSSYASTDYEYNALSKIGTNDIESSFGFAYKVINQPQTIFKLSAGPSFEWISGGSECDIEPSCGDMLSSGSLGANLNWSISENLKLLVDNKFSSRFTSNAFYSNRFSTALRFYPIRDSNFYTSLNYENFYDAIKDPAQEQNYNLKIGTTF